jgi:acetolactate synthase-1/2/3 large subunit
MKGTEFILRAIRTEGVSHVFLVPGGLLDPFYVDLTTAGLVQPIVAAQEGGAAYMADGYARASGRFGVCFAIGGPGVTNTVTAVATALTDESPLLVLSGEVPTDWEGRGGFQDGSAAAVDDVSILKPITAYSIAVENHHLLAHHLRAALTAMLDGGGRPVHLSVPGDIQQAEIAAAYRPLFPGLYQPRSFDPTGIEAFWSALGRDGSSAGGPTKIAILAGYGVVRSGAEQELRLFAERYAIPVATTLKAKGALPEDHPLSLGVFGYAGTRHATEVLLSGACEVLIVLGSGLNQRDTMFWDRRLRPARALIQVDDRAEVFGRTYPTEVAIHGDCRSVLSRLLEVSRPDSAALEAGTAAREAWLRSIRASGPRVYDAENCASDAVPLHPARVIAELRRVAPRETVVLVDSGAHRAFAGQYWECYDSRRYISATNLGPMGWAIPAGIGAKLARPDAPCVVITGDGCMLMHGMEVQTAARHHVPVVWVVLNNGALGNVYLRAREMGPGPAALTILPTHDWAGFARALGAHGALVERPEQLAPAFEEALAADAPFVVDVRCGKDYPTPVSPWSEAKRAWMDTD